MKISLVIPSTPNHFRYIDCILKNYENGTEKPDEVIISVSEGNRINSQLIEELKSKYSNSFGRLEFVLNNRQVMEGPNRGIGSEHTTCEYITYHDSDDIPHPQRIEIIKHFFKNYDILHLNHSYKYETGFDEIKIEDIKIADSKKLYSDHFGDGNYTERPLNYFPDPNNRAYGCCVGFWVCGGPTTIHRSVLDHIKWNENRILSYDYDFCMDVLFKFNKSMAIDSTLIWYNKTGDASWAC
jgi:hypothetical protein